MDFILPNHSSMRYNSHTTMKNTRKAGKMVSAEQIARMAELGIDVSRFFSNTGKMMRPIKRQC